MLQPQRPELLRKALHQFRPGSEFVAFHGWEMTWTDVFFFLTFDCLKHCDRTGLLRKLDVSLQFIVSCMGSSSSNLGLLSILSNIRTQRQDLVEVSIYWVSPHLRGVIFRISSHIKTGHFEIKKWINEDDVFDPLLPGSLESLGRSNSIVTYDGSHKPKSMSWGGCQHKIMPFYNFFEASEFSFGIW